MTLDYRQLALEFIGAEESRQPLDPLTARFPEISVADAYQIQLEGIALKTAGGQRIVGKKIGLTSKAMQQLLLVPEPDYGQLLDSMLIPPGEAAPISRLLQPKAEGEIAFFLGRDLTGPGITYLDVLNATEAVAPAIEIVDSRVRDWKIRIQDTVADNASSALFVVGNKLTSPRELDLRLVGMTFEKNGAVAGTGTGAAVLGHPAHAVAWLANKLGEFGISLKAGEVILSGALTAAPPAQRGDLFTAHFDRLGSVSVTFI